MSVFKKFIETNGKTLEEIKAGINKMVNNAVDTVVNDVTQFVPREMRRQIKSSVKDAREKRGELRYNYQNAEKIPPRRPNTSDEVQPRHINKPNPIYYPHESVPDNLSPQDEYMQGMISKMRDLEVVTDNSYLTTGCALDNLIIQGEYMKDVEDDYEHNAFCGLAKPIHAMMSVSQLRTYFTWRTDARRGKYRETDKSYVLLYCYEILNKIGVSGAEDAFNKLNEIYKNCIVFAPSLKILLPRWIKDFYAYNEISSPPPDFGGEILPYNHDIQEAVGECYKNKFAYLADNSSYSIKDSIFLNEETKCMMNEACEEVLNALSEYFKKYGVKLSELICGKMKKDFSWDPFSGALVDLNRHDGFRPVKISGMECYDIKRGKPVHEFFEFVPSRCFIGYILKSVEARLRIQTGFKHNLKPALTYVENEFKNRSKLMEAISSEEFTAVISQAVDAYCTEKGIVSPKADGKKNGTKKSAVSAPIKVDIDISKLDKIRELADENAKKLIILDETEVEDLSEKVSDENFDEQINDFLQQSNSSTQQTSSLDNLPKEWRQFAQSLKNEHICFLRCLLNGTEDVCRQKHIMPELMSEDINNIALNCINDVVIENNDLVDDYVKIISEICDSLFN